MIFKRLTLQNFKSFKDRQAINLDLGHTADGKKVLLIGGMNGGGKTTLLEAVNYCLYGARNEQIFDRINRQNLHSGNANVHLELCFETDDCREVVIQRTWQPNDLSKLPALKELVAYLIIERFYREMSALPDSEVGEETFRQIRTILVIDEAHNYLGQKNQFLQKIVREGRSKGIGVFFASQSPNDYNQDDFNFQELLEFVLIFQCEGVSPRAIQNLVGCPQSVARDLQQDIARLQPGHVVTKPSVGARSNYVEFTATPFYKAYS
jgi:hypothetical protein